MVYTSTHYEYSPISGDTAASLFGPLGTEPVSAPHHAFVAGSVIASTHQLAEGAHVLRSALLPALTGRSKFSGSCMVPNYAEQQFEESR
jgi:hypothetical protein